MEVVLIFKNNSFKQNILNMNYKTLSMINTVEIR